MLASRAEARIGALGRTVTLVICNVQGPCKDHGGAFFLRKDQPVSWSRPPPCPRTASTKHNVTVASRKKKIDIACAIDTRVINSHAPLRHCFSSCTRSAA